eukprot:3708700-Rhodomonas_salina.3
MRARNKVILRSCHRGLIESWATSFRFCAKHKVGLVLSAVHPTEDSRPSCVLSPKDCAPSAADRRPAEGCGGVEEENEQTKGQDGGDGKNRCARSVQYRKDRSRGVGKEATGKRG